MCSKTRDPNEAMKRQQQQERLSTVLHCNEDRFTTTYIKEFKNPWIEDRVGVKPLIEGNRQPVDTFVPNILPDCDYRPNVRKMFKEPMQSGNKHSKGVVYIPLEEDPRELEWNTTYNTTICKTAQTILNKKLLSKRKLNYECL